MNSYRLGLRGVLSFSAAAVVLTACGGDPAPTAGAPVPSVTSEATPAPKVAKAASVADPARIEIPAIGVDATLVPLGLERNGAMEVPAFGKAGWYTEGPKPGTVGPSVIAAHVDSKTGPDVFARLKELRKGAKITVTDKDGKDHTFTVERSKKTAKTALPAKEIWGKTNSPALRLITCGGAFDEASGHYTDNVTVFANAAA